jgi:transposase
MIFQVGVESDRMKRFREYQPDQLLLLPPDLREWLPDKHEVHFILDAVESLDLSEIYNSYDSNLGQPPYSPRMMVAVLFYGYCRGIRSSRGLERALYEDVAFRVLSASLPRVAWKVGQR